MDEIRYLAEAVCDLAKTSVVKYALNGIMIITPALVLLAGVAISSFYEKSKDKKSKGLRSTHFACCGYRTKANFGVGRNKTSRPPCWLWLWSLNTS
mgnify:CR=1 FL=1